MRFSSFLIKHFHISHQDKPNKTQHIFQNHSQMKKRPEIKSICTHSQKVQNQSLFVAIKGQKTDGHNYIPEAIQKGATVLLVEKDSLVPSDFKGLILKSKDTRKDLALVLNEYYQCPSQKLFMIGVTGTNGKTTISYMLEHILNSCGWATALIGTIDQHFKNQHWLAQLTTPDPIETFERLHDFYHLGAKACVMEVSSIGLDQKRAEGIDFKAAIFTNLTHDHLDYHLNLENYFQAKKKLFLKAINQKDKNFFCIINNDDKYGRRLIKDVPNKIYTYGSQESDFCFKITHQTLNQTIFDLKTPFGSTQVILPLVGEYNVYNAVAALACATVIGFKLEDSKHAIESFKFIIGRLQKVTNREHPFEVFVDYAHTPVALGLVLKNLQQFKKDQNLIVVFGCGGDRDKQKRSSMVQAATQYADKVFLTSDNPRFENPESIIKEGLKNLKPLLKHKITEESDREQAIKKAIFFAKEGDLVLIAGKGHEKFQIVQGEKKAFDDVEVAKMYLKKRFG